MMTANLQTLAPDVFEAVVTAFADTLIRNYRERCGLRTAEPAVVPAAVAPASPLSPWLRAGEAAKRAQCSVRILYSEVQAGRLRAARVGGGRALRFRTEWIDEWLQGDSKGR
jgi:excisionase family DNA binding protein